MYRQSLSAVLFSAIFLKGCVSSANEADSRTALPNIATATSPVYSPITVATWNAEHLAFPLDTGCKPRTQHDLKAMQSYVNSVNADVFALQEIASQEALSQLFPASGWQVFVSSRPDSPVYDCRGSGFTSTQQKVAFAIKRHIPVKSVNFLDALGLDMPGLRYGMSMTIETSAGELDILNVHLKSGCFVDDYQKSDSPACQVLAQQVPVLDKWVKEREQATRPFVIMGDFNHRISAPYNRLTRTVFNNTDMTQIATRHLIGCHPRYPAPIDHIVVSGLHSASLHKSTRVHHFEAADEQAMLSDHCAVSARLFADEPTISTAVKWQTQSKEYKALTESVYLDAAEAVRAYSATDANWVVVMDVDETVLDNSAYQVSRERLDASYTPESWRDWVAQEKAALVPGVAAFMQTVFDKGGRIALVTNRDKSLDHHTWQNLIALGLQIDKHNTCLIGRTPQDKQAVGTPGIANDKDLRRQHIRSGMASCFQRTREINLTWKAPHTIAFQVGDNIEDFAGVTQAQADIESLRPLLGQTLFILPNPMYGSWQ